MDQKPAREKGVLESDRPLATPHRARATQSRCSGAVPSLVWSTSWFGSCAALTGWLGFGALGGFGTELQNAAIGCLGLSGAAAGVLLVRPMRWALREERLVAGAMLGTLASLIALELGLVLTLLTLRIPIAIPAGLMLAPIFGVGGWAIGGPLSGLGWVWLVGPLWRELEARRQGASGLMAVDRKE